MKSKLFTVIMLLVAICFPFVVNAADLTPAYLDGNLADWRYSAGLQGPGY